MSVKIDAEALRAEADPSQERATLLRPMVLGLPVSSEDGYTVRLTSAQFVGLLEQMNGAASQRRRMLEQFEVDAIGQDPADEASDPADDTTG